MKIPQILLACWMALVCAAIAQNQELPSVEGYVTRVGSNSDFDVDGMHVMCGAQTQSVRHSISGKTVSNSGCPNEIPYLGRVPHPCGVFVLAARVGKHKLQLATLNSAQSLRWLNMNLQVL
jgi:hypothetical protein